MTRIAVLLGAWVGLGASGCVSTGMARPVDKGSLQVSISGGAVNVGSLDTREELPPYFVSIPQGDLNIRYGLTDRMDVGARLFPVGGAVDGRFALLRAPSLQRGIDLTLAPLILYSRHGKGGWGSEPFMQLELPLLLGVNVRGSQFVFGAKVGTYFGPEKLQSDSFSPTLGTSLGVAIPIVSWLRIMPEINVRVRPTGTPTLPFVFNGGVGLIFGGYAASSQPEAPRVADSP